MISLGKIPPAMLYISCAVTVPTAAWSQVIGVERAPTVIGLDGSELYRARKVLRQFFAKERNPECYRVLFSQFEGNLRVDFIPKKPDPVRYEGDPNLSLPTSVCGRNVGYVIDARGKIMRRIYSR